MITYDVIDWIRTPLPCVATGATGPCRQREAKEVKTIMSPGTQRIGIEVNGLNRHFERRKNCACPEMGGTQKIDIPFFLSQV